MRTCPPCNGNCNQGRDCPAKPNVPTGYVIAGFVIIGMTVGWLFGEHRGEVRGRELGAKAALSTKPVSEELELVCAGLWIGEQNKKYWEKEKNK